MLPLLTPAFFCLLVVLPAFLAGLFRERAQTEKAIAAFSALADRLDQLAAERARPWWRRLAGT